MKEYPSPNPLVFSHSPPDRPVVRGEGGVGGVGGPDWFLNQEEMLESRTAGVAAMHIAAHHGPMAVNEQPTTYPEAVTCLKMYRLPAAQKKKNCTMAAI